MPQSDTASARVALPGRRRSIRQLLRRHPRLRKAVLAMTALLAAGDILVGIMLYPVLSRPGTDPVAARVAEWARDNHLGSVVTWLEQQTYTPPQVGGQVAEGSPLTQADAARPTPPARATRLPGTLRPFATPALPSEGVWHVLSKVRGADAMAAAYLRPDATHTSYTAGVVWVDPKLVRAQLNPGTLDPGGNGWGAPVDLLGVERSSLLAAFNSGFRLNASRGGYVQNGKTARPLVKGAASMIFSQDGTLTVGAWGRDAHMSQNVAAVRQNLSLLVDGGAIVPGVASDTDYRWGATIGHAKYVWRSGVGMRADGTIVYVASDRLTALTLAQLLQRAGVVRGMELDINHPWTSFVRYQPGPDNLLPDMRSSRRRYDEPSSRDFVSLFARP